MPSAKSKLAKKRKKARLTSATRQRKSKMTTGRKKAKKRARKVMKKDKAADVVQPEGLQKVRDILFGSQSRDTERRILRIQERGKKESQQLRDETRRRLDSLETYFKSEIGTLLERVKDEQAERTVVVKDMSRKLGTTIKELEKRVAKLDERATKDHRDLRKDVLDQSKILRDEIARAEAQLEAAREEACDELRTEKIDVTALGELFSEFAVRLKKGLNGSTKR